MPSTRRQIAALTVLALLGPAAFVRAQPADSALVEERIEALRTLMIDPDRSKLEAIFADQLTYGHSDGRVQTKAEIIDGLVNHRSEFHSIKLSEQSVAIAEDVAVVRHRFQADAVSNGKPGHPDIHVLQIWRRQASTWRLLARQAY